MDQQQIKQLEELFNRFANEEQCSSFAVNHLFNQVIRIFNDNQTEQPNLIEDKEG